MGLSEILNHPTLVDGTVVINSHQMGHAFVARDRTQEYETPHPFKSLRGGSEATTTTILLGQIVLFSRGRKLDAAKLRQPAPLHSSCLNFHNFMFKPPTSSLLVAESSMPKAPLIRRGKPKEPLPPPSSRQVPCHPWTDHPPSSSSIRRTLLCTWT